MLALDIVELMARMECLQQIVEILVRAMAKQGRLEGEPHVARSPQVEER